MDFHKMLFYVDFSLSSFFEATDNVIVILFVVGAKNDKRMVNPHNVICLLSSAIQLRCS